MFSRPLITRSIGPCVNASRSAFTKTKVGVQYTSAGVFGATRELSSNVTTQFESVSNDISAVPHKIVESAAPPLFTESETKPSEDEASELAALGIKTPIQDQRDALLSSFSEEERKTALSMLRTRPGIMGFIGIHVPSDLIERVDEVHQKRSQTIEFLRENLPYFLHFSWPVPGSLSDEEIASIVFNSEGLINPIQILRLVDEIEAETTELTNIFGHLTHHAVSMEWKYGVLKAHDYQQMKSISDDPSQAARKLWEETKIVHDAVIAASRVISMFPDFFSVEEHRAIQLHMKEANLVNGLLQGLEERDQNPSEMDTEGESENGSKSGENSAHMVLKYGTHLAQFQAAEQAAKSSVILTPVTLHGVSMKEIPSPLRKHFQELSDVPKAGEKSVFLDKFAPGVIATILSTSPDVKVRKAAWNANEQLQQCPQFRQALQEWRLQANSIAKMTQSPSFASFDAASTALGSTESAIKLITGAHLCVKEIHQKAMRMLRDEAEKQSNNSAIGFFKSKLFKSQDNSLSPVNVETGLKIESWDAAYAGEAGLPHKKNSVDKDTYENFSHALNAFSALRSFEILCGSILKLSMRNVVMRDGSPGLHHSEKWTIPSTESAAGSDIDLLAAASSRLGILKYELRDHLNEVKGILYLDLFEAVGKPRGASASVVLGTYPIPEERQPGYGFEDFEYDDGMSCIPSVVLKASIPISPVKVLAASDPYVAVELDAPTYVALLHELGHALHFILAKNTFQKTSPLEAERDLLEIPSLFFENFAAHPGFIQRAFVSTEGLTVRGLSEREATLLAAHMRSLIMKRLMDTLPIAALQQRLLGDQAPFDPEMPFPGVTLPTVIPGPKEQQIEFFSTSDTIPAKDGHPVLSDEEVRNITLQILQYYGGVHGESPSNHPDVESISPYPSIPVDQINTLFAYKSVAYSYVLGRMLSVVLFHRIFPRKYDLNASHGSLVRQYIFESTANTIPLVNVARILGLNVSPDKKTISPELSNIILNQLLREFKKSYEGMMRDIHVKELQ